LIPVKIESNDERMSSRAKDLIKYQEFEALEMLNEMLNVRDL
jgi:hypothetical protein